jgi:hypothetical protein
MSDQTTRDVCDPNRWGLPRERIADFLTILATWFIAQTKYDWLQTHPRDPQLAHQMELDVLPALSVANVRELLQAVMPLPQLSQDQATHLVVKHLVQRSRSTRSRLKAQRKRRSQT